MRPQGMSPYPLPPQPNPQQPQPSQQFYPPPTSAYPPPSNFPPQATALVTPAPLYPHARPPPPLQTSLSPNPIPFNVASPSSLSGARSPPPPMPGPPPQPSPYAHPPPSSLAPFPYPRAPLPPSNLLSPSSSSPASTASSPTHSSVHPFTFPLPSPSSAAHLPSPSSANPQISSTSILPHHRPPPLSVPTSSSPPPPLPAVIATDEGPMSVPQSAAASPVGQHRGHFYPAVGGMNGMARSQSYMSPRGDYPPLPQPQSRSVVSPHPQHAQASQALPQPLPQPYPPPMPNQPSQSQYPPASQPNQPMPQPGYPQPYPDPSYPPPPQHSSLPSHYSAPASLPPRLSWVKPVSPAYMQAASAYFPDTPELFDDCQLPFGIFMRPLGPGLSLPVSESNPYPAQPPASAGVASPTTPSPYPPPPSAEPPIPIVRPGQAGVIRCKECKAYINGYVSWFDQGRQWKCNICLTDNPTASAYFSPLNSEGRRMDWDEREELKNASYELYAPKDYMVRPPVPPLVCLAIDVSQQAQRGGMLNDVCAAVLSLIDTMAAHPKSLLSVVTFSDQVHYYTIQTKARGANMHVLSTLDDLFLPSPIGLLIRVADCKEQLISLFQSLPSIHARAEPAPLCTASALECCMMIMGRYGGRLMCFVSSFCGVGRGLMTDRERELVEKAKGGEGGVEGQLLKAGTDYYKKLSETMQKHQITCDLFFFPPSFTPTSPPLYCDVTTYSDLARYTGGQLYYYPSYSPRSTPSLTSTLTSILTRPQCFESVFRVRVSKGIQISDFHGHFSIRGQDLLSLPCVDNEKGVSFELKIDDKEKGHVVGSKDRVVVVQTGLLYTSFVGERKIVVHTLVIPIAKEVRKVVEGMDVDVCVGLMSKRAVWLAYAHSLNQARQFIRQKCGSVVRVWQKGQVSPPQREGLVPYQPVVSFSSLCLFLLKSCFGEQGAVYISPDQRAYLLSTLYVLPLPDTIRLIYPTLISLHWLPHDPRYGSLDPTSTILVPPSLPLTRASLTPDSVLLLHNAVTTLVRVGGYADQALVGAMVEEERGGWRLRGKEAGELIGRVWAVVDEVRKGCGLMSRVQVVREGDAMDGWFQSLMVEDQRGQEPGLREWEAMMR